MNDRYRDGSGDDSPRQVGDPGTPDGPGTVSDVLALDALIDEVGAGRDPRSGDRLLDLLSAARAELDGAAQDRPVAPPDLSVLLPETPGDPTCAPAGTPVTVLPVERAGLAGEGRHRRRPRRGLRLTGRAAAAGGISVTGMVIAGGVAAALAVGGLGVAAYHGAIPGIPARSDMSGPRDAGETSAPVSGTPADRARTTAPSGTVRNGTPEKSRPAGTTTDAGRIGAPGTSAQAEPTEATEDPEPTGAPGTAPAEPTGSPDPTDTPVEPTGSPEDPADPVGPADPAKPGEEKDGTPDAGPDRGQGHGDDVPDAPAGDGSGSGTGA